MSFNPITLRFVSQSGPSNVNVNWISKLLGQTAACYPNGCVYVAPEKLTYFAMQVSDNAQFTNPQTISLLPLYYTKKASLTIPTSRTNYLRLLIKTIHNNTNYSKFSNVLTIDSRTVPSSPINITATSIGNNSVRVRWNEPLNDGGYDTLGYVAQYSTDNGLTWFSKAYSGVGPILPEFINTVTFDALIPNNYYIFRVIATNDKGSSVPSQATKAIFLESATANVNNMLFDKSSWDSAPSPWKEYLTFAANEWEKYVKINPNVAKALIGYDSNFTGIKLKTLNISNTPAPIIPGALTAYTASVEIDEVINLGGNNPYSVKAMTVGFSLTVNNHSDITTLLNPNQIRTIMVHQLGHALGFGILWQPEWISKLNKHPSISGFGEAQSRWQLKGTFGGEYFTNAQQAYNQKFGFTSPRKVMPLAWNPEFNNINKVAHWAHNRNPANQFTTYHPPLNDDIMSYAQLLPTESITSIGSVTVGALLDLGYVLQDQAVGEPSILVLPPPIIILNDILLTNISSASIIGNIALKDNVEVESATFFDV